MSVIGQDDTSKIKDETSKIKIKSTSRKKKKNVEIYSSAIITRSAQVPITMVGKNIKETLKNIISNEIEGKCIAQGYIKPNSINIITYSNGVVDGSNINFEIVIECFVCNPVEGMHILCIAKNITKAGIRAQLSEENNPLIIFIARDHNYMSKNFSTVEENQEIKIRVIGQRFELNDLYISIIGELLETKSRTKQKIKLVSQSEEVALDIPLTVISEDSIGQSIQATPNPSISTVKSPVVSKQVSNPTNVKTIASPIASPVISPVISPKTSPVISPKTSPVISPKTSPVISPKTSPVISPKTSPVISPKTSPVISPKTSLEPSVTLQKSSPSN